MVTDLNFMLAVASLIERKTFIQYAENILNLRNSYTRSIPFDIR